MRVSAAGEDWITHLGYDPRPKLTHWKGTPIPPIDDPLAASPRRCEIAERVWWNGPAWTVLRNASTYLWHVMDYGFTEDIGFTLREVERTRWVRALEVARPGALSKGSYVLWSCYFGLMADDAICDWPAMAHRLDLKPLADDSRETMYKRHRTYRAHRAAQVES
ncbi:MAG: hypothetical protein OXS47_04130 [Chloroflexota bacterium]|nr:hypothetical protein [Chloroflexota bacterium]